MAESVDALVSNTSGATRAGSTPALGTRLQSESAVDLFSTALFLFSISLSSMAGAPFYTPYIIIGAKI